MMLAGALAHNAGLRPIRAAITAAEAKKVFKAMIAVLQEIQRTVGRGALPQQQNESGGIRYAIPPYVLCAFL